VIGSLRRLLSRIIAVAGVRQRRVTLATRPATHCGHDASIVCRQRIPLFCCPERLSRLYRNKQLQHSLKLDPCLRRASIGIRDNALPALQVIYSCHKRAITPATMRERHAVGSREFLSIIADLAAWSVAGTVAQ